MSPIAGCTSASADGLATATHASQCVAAPSGASPVGNSTAVGRWVAAGPMYVAHRGGDSDWVEGTADAYSRAAGWNPQVALEVPVWMTSDGVWVVSEDGTTGRVFDTNYDISKSTWSTLSALHTKDGGFPITRLVEDVLVKYGSSRILFIDNKSDRHVKTFFKLLDAHGGHNRIISKGYYKSVNTAAEAHARGYVTWGYYMASDMTQFAATESRFDMVGLNFSAPGPVFATMRATGKPIIATLVGSGSDLATATCAGAWGFMVSAIPEVVPSAAGTPSTATPTTPSG